MKARDEWEVWSLSFFSVENKRGRKGTGLDAAPGVPGRNRVETGEERKARLGEGKKERERWPVVRLRRGGKNEG